MAAACRSSADWLLLRLPYKFGGCDDCRVTAKGLSSRTEHMQTTLKTTSIKGDSIQATPTATGNNEFDQSIVERRLQVGTATMPRLAIRRSYLHPLALQHGFRQQENMSLVKHFSIGKEGRYKAEIPRRILRRVQPPLLQPSGYRHQRQDIRQHNGRRVGTGGAIFQSHRPGCRTVRLLASCVPYHRTGAAKRPSFSRRSTVGTAEIRSTFDGRECAHDGDAAKTLPGNSKKKKNCSSRIRSRKSVIHIPSTTFPPRHYLIHPEWMTTLTAL